MERIENRIICETYEDGKYSYHRFILEEINGDFIIRFKNEFDTFKFPENKMRTISFPVDYIPQFSGMISKVFFADVHSGSHIKMETENNILFASITDDDRYLTITKLSFGAYTKDDELVDLIDLEWPDKKIPWEVSKRVMPESLVWLLKNLKDFYNIWQKDHSEHPKME